jgi:hypothetical protein
VTTGADRLVTDPEIRPLNWPTPLPYSSRECGWQVVEGIEVGHSRWDAETPETNAFGPAPVVGVEPLGPPIYPPRFVLKVPGLAEAAFVSC